MPAGVRVASSLPASRWFPALDEPRGGLEQMAIQASMAALPEWHDRVPALRILLVLSQTTNPHDTIWRCWVAYLGVRDGQAVAVPPGDHQARQVDVALGARATSTCRVRQFLPLDAQRGVVSGSMSSRSVLVTCRAH